MGHLDGKSGRRRCIRSNASYYIIEKNSKLIKYLNFKTKAIIELFSHYRGKKKGRTFFIISKLERPFYRWTKTLKSQKKMLIKLNTVKIKTHIWKSHHISKVKWHTGKKYFQIYYIQKSNFFSCLRNKNNKQRKTRWKKDIKR